MLLNILIYLGVFCIVVGVGGSAYLFLRRSLRGRRGTGWFLKPKRVKRLDVVEQWVVDARRKLVLVRRDDVEHLIMTGGPVDVVIETGIRTTLSGTPVATNNDEAFHRPVRTLRGSV